MFDSRPRRIGVGMMSVRTSANAGVSRYALAIVEGLAVADPSVRFECYVRPEFEPPSTWNSLPNIGLHRVRMYKAVRFGSGWRPPIVGYHAWFAPAYDLLRLTPIRQVAMVHDVFPLTNPEWFADDAVASIARGVREAALVSRPVLVNSEFTGRTLRELFRIDSDRVVVTPLGPGNQVVPPGLESVTDEALSELGVPFRRFFLTVGTLEPRKNLLSLFEAFARISGDPGHEDVGLVVVGARGWKDQAAIARLGAPDLRDRVAWLGYLSDASLAFLFARCEAYVCPSLSEGFGMPVLEAMRAGAPVLSSSSGALPEVGGSACRYFDPLDILSLASLLKQTLEKPDQRAEWSALGQKQAARFSWRQTVWRTLEALVGPTPWSLGKPHGQQARSRPIHSGSFLRTLK